MTLLRRWLKFCAITGAAIALFLIAVLSALWFWSNSPQSLALSLTQIAQWLPANQKLETREVTGTLRTGGRIGWLRWQSPELRIEVQQLAVQWNLAQLFKSQVQITQLHANLVQITPHSSTANTTVSTEESTPLQDLKLPLHLDIPLQIETLQILQTSNATTTPNQPRFEAKAINGHYQYNQVAHSFKLHQLQTNQAKVQFDVQLQDTAPINVEANLVAQINAPIEHSQTPQLHATIKVLGTLAGAEARLNVSAQITPEVQILSTDNVVTHQKTAKLHPKPQSSPPHLELQASVLPWSIQPLEFAALQFESINLAQFIPDAPQTLLSATLSTQPIQSIQSTQQVDSAQDETTGLQIELNLKNQAAGTWDTGRLPLDKLHAKMDWIGQKWHLTESLLHINNSQIALQGWWQAAAEMPTQAADFKHQTNASKAHPSDAPDSSFAAWEINAQLHQFSPSLIHPQFKIAPINGTIFAANRAETILFNTALKTALRGSDKIAQHLSAPLKRAPFELEIRELSTQGKWHNNCLELSQLRLQTNDGLLEGQSSFDVVARLVKAQLSLKLPGLRASYKGFIAPLEGAGNLNIDITNAAKTQQALQKWGQAVPELAAIFQAYQAAGSLQLDAQWQGGFEKISTAIAPPKASPAPVANSTKAKDMVLKAELKSTEFTFSSAQQRLFAMHDLTLNLNGALAKLDMALKGKIDADNNQLQIEAQLQGGLNQKHEWFATIASLKAQLTPQKTTSSWLVNSEKPWQLSLKNSLKNPQKLQINASAGQLWVQRAGNNNNNNEKASVSWEPLQFSQMQSGNQTAYRLQSKGQLQGLPMAWLPLLGADGASAESADAAPAFKITGDLIFDGEWDIAADETLRTHLKFARRSGDLQLKTSVPSTIGALKTNRNALKNQPSAASPFNQITLAGIEQAQIELSANNQQLKANLNWNSLHAGNITAELKTALERNEKGWYWSPQTPVTGSIQAHLPRMESWSMFAPPGWRIQGAVTLAAQLAGSAQAPRWHGNLSADNLSLRSSVEGFDLRNGTLRALLQGERLELQEFTLYGATGKHTRISGQAGNRSSANASDGGSVTMTGEINWASPLTPALSSSQPANDGSNLNARQLRINLQTQAKFLRLLNRADRQVTLSGTLQTQFQEEKITVDGSLKIDRAAILLADETAPSLGADVIVHRLAKNKTSPPDEAAATPSPFLPKIRVDLNLGDDFAIQGLGLTTRLEGTIDIRNSGAKPQELRVTGEIRTANGQYRAYGQKLNIESGIARFTGAYNNPALDILAVRPNLAVRAGVKINGTALSPKISLFSDPEMPDEEKLSWVIFGRSSGSGGAEAMLLQQAALSLLKSDGQSPTEKIANTLGLDEIGFKSGESESESNAITVGKRLSRKLYVTYQHSLAGALGTFYIFYDISRRLTLRGQAGLQSGIDLIFTQPYE